MTGIRRRIPELTLVEHEFSVPLDYASPGGETITVFARELVGDASGEGEFPLLVFFQGGPGHEAPRTNEAPAPRSWLERALKEYRVLMLDQRGTGRSTPAGALTGMSPEQQADSSRTSVPTRSFATRNGSVATWVSTVGASSGRASAASA